MSILAQRRTFLKSKARLLAADVVGFTSASASGLFDDLNLSDQELELVQSELQAISNRIRRTTKEAADV